MTITEDGQMIQVDTGEAGEEAAGEVLPSILLKAQFQFVKHCYFTITGGGYCLLHFIHVRS